MASALFILLILGNRKAAITRRIRKIYFAINLRVRLFLPFRITELQLMLCFSEYLHISLHNYCTPLLKLPKQAGGDSVSVFALVGEEQLFQQSSHFNTVVFLFIPDLCLCLFSRLPPHDLDVVVRHLVPDVRLGLDLVDAGGGVLVGLAVAGGGVHAACKLGRTTQVL